jgi:hypothetical protein
MRKVRLTPAMTLRNRLIPFIVFENLCMNGSSATGDPGYDKKGKGYSRSLLFPFPLFYF